MYLRYYSKCRSRYVSLVLYMCMCMYMYMYML